MAIPVPEPEPGRLGLRSYLEGAPYGAIRTGLQGYLEPYAAGKPFSIGPIGPIGHGKFGGLPIRETYGRFNIKNFW